MQQRPHIDLSRGNLIGQLGWRGIVALAITVAILVSLFLVAGMIFLIVLPIAIVGGLIARWFAGKQAGQARERSDKARPPPVVEADFEVVEISSDENASSERDPWRKPR